MTVDPRAVALCSIPPAFQQAEVIAKSGQAIQRAARPSLQQFERTLVAVAALAKQRNTSSRALLQQIAIRPVTGPDIDDARQYFFRRADLAEEVQEANPGASNAPRNSVGLIEMLSTQGQLQSSFVSHQAPDRIDSDCDESQSRTGHLPAPHKTDVSQ